MLSINIDDVLSVLTTLRPYLIALGIIIVAWIILRIIVGKVMKKNPAKRRTKAGLLVALLAGICIVVNMICTGPMSTMLDLISGSGTISKETSDAATEIAVQIGEEGIALLENDDNILPMTSGDKLNVFGWASINPILGGAGSGALNDAYVTTDILQSLSEAGIETNSELTQFYTDYKADRPEVGMWAQDWTLPEPNVSLYTDTLMSNAKSFSDTAMIVISRSGGEGADLPANMPAVVDGSFQDGTTYTAGVYDDTLNDGNDWDEGDHYLQLTNREEDMIDLVCSNFDNVILVYNGANAFELGFVEDYDQIKGVLWTAGQGHVGMKALGEIVAGTVNPSAKLIDTYIYDFETAPWWNNFGDFNYENMDDMSYTSTGFTGVESTAYVSFVNYVEGIYVG